MANGIIGGKDHAVAYATETVVGEPPATGWKYPGVLKGFKVTHGLQVAALTGLANRYPWGWSKEGYDPAVNLTLTPSGPNFYDLIESAFKDSVDTAGVSQSWEIYKSAGSLGGYNAALAMGAIIKTLGITKNGFSAPLEVSLDMAARFVQLTETETGGKSDYNGFKNVDVPHPTPAVAPWLGAHVAESISGITDAPLIPLRSWNLQITRDIETILGKMTGDDSVPYTVPVAFSWQRATAALVVTLGAQGWEWWKHTYTGDDNVEFKLKFTPPANAGIGTEKTITLSGGQIMPLDLEIKELAALDFPVRIEFKGVAFN